MLPELVLEPDVLPELELVVEPDVLPELELVLEPEAIDADPPPPPPPQDASMMAKNGVRANAGRYLAILITAPCGP